jgi:hypothetical protein
MHPPALAVRASAVNRIVCLWHKEFYAVIYRQAGGVTRPRSPAATWDRSERPAVKLVSSLIVALVRVSFATEYRTPGNQPDASSEYVEFA